VKYNLCYISNKLNLLIITRFINNQYLYLLVFEIISIKTFIYSMHYYTLRLMINHMFDFENVKIQFFAHLIYYLIYYEVTLLYKFGILYILSTY